jgi:hypothetical protein
MDAGETGLMDADGGGIDEKPGQCQASAHDFGIIQPGASPVRRRAELPPMTESNVKAECSRTDRPEKVFKFEVSGPNRTSIDISGIQGSWDPVVEVRKGSCELSDRESCSDMESLSLSAQPGITYYLVVEPGAGGTLQQSTAFDIELRVSEIACQPPGGFRCADETNVEKCFPQEGWTKLSCPDRCTPGGPSPSCTGLSCAKPIPVDSFPSSFSGAHEPFLGLDTFKDHPSCSESPQRGSEGLDTPGEEVFFALKGLKQGESITVDASQSDEAGNGDNDHAIFVVDSCEVYEAKMGRTEPSTPPPNACNGLCCAASDARDMLTWTVPKDGDYLVVVDDLAFGVPEGRTIDVAFSKN